MAVKTSWSSGDVLTAADLTDTFAAKASLAGATYTGTHNFTGATVTGIASGLALITTQSFTTASAVNVNNCFTSTYNNYRVIVDFTSFTASLAVSMRLRASGTDSSSGYYSGQFFSPYGAAQTNYGSRVNNGSSIPLIASVASAPHYIDLALHNPANATVTGFDGMAMDSFNIAGNFTMGLHSVASSHDGFSIIASTSTFTGSVSVYGYRD